MQWRSKTWLLSVGIWTVQSKESGEQFCSTSCQSSEKDLQGLLNSLLKTRSFWKSVSLTNSDIFTHNFEVLHLQLSTTVKISLDESQSKYLIINIKLSNMLCPQKFKNLQSLKTAPKHFQVNNRTFKFKLWENKLPD